MKFINKRKMAYLGSAIILSTALTACNKYLDVNDTPNNPLEVPPTTLLSTGIVGAAFSNNNDLNRFGSTIMSVTAGAAGGPQGYDRYTNNSASFGNQWRYEIYGGALINFQQLINDTQTENPIFAGVAKIMKAYTFALATDTWNDIPYSEALQGDLEVINPRLDSQRDIYLGNEAQGIQSLFDLIREGIADLDKASILPLGTGDIVYGGNIENWKRAGYTLMLKLALQISGVEPDFARNVINEVLAGGTFIQQNNQNFQVNFGSQVNSQSPVHVYTNVSSFSADMLISTRFINRLQSTNDPRLPIFVTRPTGAYVTIDNGFAGTVAPLANRSLFSPYVTGPNGEGPVRLLTNWQRAFILAEAVLRLGVPGDAQALYQEGIRASMLSAMESVNAVNSENRRRNDILRATNPDIPVVENAELTEGAIEAYFEAHPEVVTLSGTTEQQIEQIINQKYISLYGNGLEQWNDWRRTGYPVLADHQNAVGGGGTVVRPLRAVYINEELQRNPNFPQGVPPLNDVPVWWDVQ